jgi:hypothetical protein
MPLGWSGGLQRASRTGAGALVLLLVAVGLVDALNSTTLSTGLAFAGGVALVAFLWLTINQFDTAIAIGLLLMGVVRFEPAPTDLCFALIMTVAAVTGRFRLNRVPSLLRWLVALLLVVNLASLTDVVSTSKAVRFLFITVYLCIFALWLTGFVDRPKRARLVVVTWLVIGVASAVVAALALHFPIPGRSFINGSVDKGERASAFFKDPNTFGPFLVPIAVILLEQHIARRKPRLLRMRAWSTWACLLALTLGVLFSYSRAAWANYVIAIVVMLAASSVRRRGARRAVRALVSLLLVGGITVVILSASGSLHFLEARAHLQSYDSARFAAQSLGYELGWTHPLGVGPGQFESLSPVAAQSTYVRAFAEQGFLGLVLLIALVLSTLVLALRNAVIGRDTYGIGSAALLGAWCGLIFNSTVVDTLHWRHLWVVLALIWAGGARGRLSQRGGVWTALGLARPGLRRGGQVLPPRVLVPRGQTVARSR